MYIRLNRDGDELNYVEYEKVKNVKFDPEIDITMASMPIPEFEAEIMSSAGVDAPAIGMWATLVMNNANYSLARYVLTKIRKIDKYTYYIRAQHPLYYLDQWEVGAEMFENVYVSEFVRKIFSQDSVVAGKWHNVQYFLGTSSVQRITGFCPRQTARERLNWFCLATGYCMTFRDIMHLTLATWTAREVSEDVKIIYPESVYWLPKIEEMDSVNRVKASLYYNFHRIDSGSTTNGQTGDDQIEPAVDEITDTPIETESDDSDITVEDEAGHTWGFDKAVRTINNPNPAIDGCESVLDGITLLNADASETIDEMSRFASMSFKNKIIKADILVYDNWRYYPGERVRVYTDASTLYEGYIISCSYEFGVQIKVSLEVVVISQVETCQLTVFYYHEYTTDQGGVKTMILGVNKYYLPHGEHTIKHPDIYLDVVDRVTRLTPQQRYSYPNISGDTFIEIKYDWNWR